MLKGLIAITGKSGVGKTTLLKNTSFQNIIYMDDVVKEEMYKKGNMVFEQILEIFGDEILNGDRIDTKKLGKIVFKDKEKFNQLIKITNPAIKTYLKKIKHKGFYIIEFPILLNHYKYFHKLFKHVILIQGKLDDKSDKFKYLSKGIQPIENLSFQPDFIVESYEPNAINELENTISRWMNKETYEY